MANVHKYMDIVEWTMKQINSGVFQPKDKFLSETALGKRFGFSRQTVRRALEVLEQQGHITRIQGSGTYIASQKSKPKNRFMGKGKSSMTVGVISTFMDNYIFPSIIRGIEGVLSANGYAMQFASTSNLVAVETRILQFMMERRLDGMIIEPTRSALPCVNLDLYHTIIQRGIPLIFIDSFYPELSIPYVALDDERSGYIATQYLLKMGHQNIMGIFPHSNRQGHLRYLGYVNALTEAKIPIQDDFVCWYSKENLLEILYGKQLLECMASATAALCYNDRVAYNITDFVRRNGKNVPTDLSVVGIDNSEIAIINSITSIVHPANQLGEAAANLMLSMINDSQGENILFPPQLVERGSVRKLEI